MQRVNDQITDSVTIGRKFDGGKPMYGLLPPRALRATVDVLTFGAQKYEIDNWKFVEDSERRYFDAAQRHLWAWKEGESTDRESGLHHLAHAICCLMFLYEHDRADWPMPGKREDPEQVRVDEIKDICYEGIQYTGNLVDKYK